MNLTRRISPAGIVVAVAVIAAAAVVGWLLVIVRTEEPSILPTEEPAGSATAVASPGPPSSPAPDPGTPAPTLAAVPALPPGSLPHLLTYAPDRLADGSLPLSDVARYADIAGWMEARGIATPSGPADPAFAAWGAELDNLALPGILVTRGNDPVWAQTYGFRLTEVHQVLAVGQAPDFVLILTGDFNAEALQAAWAGAGYQAVASGDETLWSLFPGDTIDLSAPASRPALGSFNNVVLLEDGTLVAASRISRLETMLEVLHGDEPSLGENEAIAALLAPGGGAQELASAVITKGSVLQNGMPLPPGTPTAAATPAPLPGGTPAAPADMAEVELALFGVQPPTDDETLGVMTLVLGFDDPEAATGAMRRVERALNDGESPLTGQPYTDRLKPFGLRIVGTDEGRALLVLRAGLAHGAQDWLTILQDRDLGFMMWNPAAAEE